MAYATILRTNIGGIAVSIACSGDSYTVSTASGKILTAVSRRELASKLRLFLASHS